MDYAPVQASDDCSTCAHIYLVIPPLTTCSLQTSAHVQDTPLLSRLASAVAPSKLSGIWEEIVGGAKGRGT